LQTLTQLNANSRIGNELQELGYANEQIPARVAEAASEAEQPPEAAEAAKADADPDADAGQTLTLTQPAYTQTLPPAAKPSIHVSRARKTRGSLGQPSPALPSPGQHRSGSAFKIFKKYFYRFTVITISY
jgi:hypothetical protein